MAASPSPDPEFPTPAVVPRPARWFVPWALAALFLLMAGAQVLLTLRPPPSPRSEEDARVLELLTDPAAARWTLREPGAEGKPLALALQDAGRRRLLVFAKKLPTLDKGRTYVLWFLRPGAGGPVPENAGAFQVAPGAGPDLVVPDATALRDLAGLAVSEETDPRAKAPTHVTAAATAGP